MGRSPPFTGCLGQQIVRVGSAAGRQLTIQLVSFHVRGWLIGCQVVDYVNSWGVGSLVEGVLYFGMLLFHFGLVGFIWEIWPMRAAFWTMFSLRVGGSDGLLGVEASARPRVRA